MKKICFVKYDMQDASGGARVCANLANALADIFEVHIISISSENDNNFYQLDSRVNYKVLFSGNKRIREILFKGISLLKKYIKDNQIDVVFSVGVGVNPFIIPATKGVNCKAVSCEHSNCMNSLGNDRSQRFCRFIGAKFADKTITLTKRDQEAYIKKYHIKQDKVENIYNWIDDSLISNEVKYNASNKKIISVGRVEALKGIDDIVEVSRKLKEKHSDWQWHIYGTGEKEYINKIKEKIEEYKLGDFLILKGSVKDIYDRYKDYSISVLTSYYEGLSMALLEAKSNKLPLISYDCLMGPSDIIREGIDGFLVPVGDIEKLYDKLDLCMSNEQERIRLSNQAYGNISLFFKDKILSKWVEFINACN